MYSDYVVWMWRTCIHLQLALRTARSRLAQAADESIYRHEDGDGAFYQVNSHTRCFCSSFRYFCSVFSGTVASWLAINFWAHVNMWCRAVSYINSGRLPV